MRSLVSRSAILRDRGLGALLVATLAFGTGCSWITGVPSVKSVEVAVSPSTLFVGQVGVANGVAIGNKGPITSTKIRVAYTSSNPSVATVNSVSGAIVAVGAGTTEISASTRGKSGSVTLTVNPAQVARAQPAASVVTIEVNKNAAVAIQAFDGANNALGTRTLTINSSNPSIATVSGTTTANVLVIAVNVGTTTITGNVEGAPFSFQVNVINPVAASMKIALQKGGTKVLIGESAQIVPSFFDAAGAPLLSGGRQVVYTSTDVTVATVTSPAGVVQGLRAGTTTITAQEVGTNVKTQLDITVEQVPVRSLLFAAINNPVFRKGATRLVLASARDSAGNAINRPIAYRSTAPNILAINATNGTVTPLDTGTAKLIATVDNLADTLNARVTLLPIASVVVQPNQPQLVQGQTLQFFATVTDSLLNPVTDRKPTWSSITPGVATINATTGVATAIAPGQTNIQAILERVPGEGVPVGGQQTLTVLATPVDTLDASSTSVSVAKGASTSITLIARSATGAQLFGRTIVSTPANAGIANAQVQGSTATIVGVGTGTTTITFQALNSGGQPEGKATTITVTVN